MRHLVRDRRPHPFASELEAARAADIAAGGRCCRYCGCTDNAACVGGCSWIADDLCDNCLPLDEARVDMALGIIVWVVAPLAGMLAVGLLIRKLASR